MASTPVSSNDSPFSVFPEEIWEIILEKVGNCGTISSVFIVYPQLRLALHGKLFMWCFGEILPLIFPKYLDIEDFRSCRLVSKLWKNATGSCLENHPDEIPYSGTPDNTGITSTHFSYFESPFLPRHLHNFQQFFEVETMNRNENPFPGRYVKLVANVGYQSYIADQLDDDVDPLDILPETGMDLLNSASLLELLGHHVSQLWLDFPFIESLDTSMIHEDFLQPLFQCLSYLPNLKSLCFKWPLDFPSHPVSHDQRQRILDFISNATFPFRLDTISIYFSKYSNYDFHLRQGDPSFDVHENLMNAFVNHKNMRKIFIQPDFWKRGFVSKFPNVTDVGIGSTDNSETLQKLLLDLKTVPIRRLKINLSDTCVGDVLKVLSQYKIESLQLCGLHAVEWHQSSQKKSPVRRLGKWVGSFFTRKSSSDEAKNTLPSVRHLKLVVFPELGVPFLKQFTSLEYLTLEIDTFYWRDDEYAPTSGMPMDLLTSAILKCCQVTEPDIPLTFGFVWKEFPHLKMLRIVIESVADRPGKYFQYVRELPRQVFVKQLEMW